MLEDAVAALASTASSALVTAMVSDGWADVKARFARLFGRDAAERAAAAHRLEQSRTTLTGLSGADLRDAWTHQEAMWRKALSDLLERDLSVAGELRALADEVQAMTPGAAGPVTQQTVAFGHAQQAVQGRGVQNITFGGHDGPVRG